MANFLTYGQCYDYTCQYRETWTDSYGKGSKTARINASHLIKYKSRGLKVKDINQGLINEMKIEYCFGQHDHTNTTVRKIIKAIQTVLNHCIDSGKLPVQDLSLKWIAPNGRFSFECPKNNKVERPILTPSEVMHFAECARSLGMDEMADTILLMCYTGLGWEEWSQLQVRDVEIGAPIPNLRIGKRPSFTVKTPARERVIPLLPGTDAYSVVMPILHKHVEACERQPEMLLLGDYWGDAEDHRDRFSRVRDYAGINPKFTPYCCRHTFITWLAHADVHPSKVMKLAGHSNIDTTLNYYTHVADDELANAMGRLKQAQAT